MTSRAGESSGFTLIELLVALSIVALTATIAASTLRRSNSLSTNEAVGALARDLRRVRTFAVERNTPVIFLIDADRRVYGANAIGVSGAFPRQGAISFKTAATGIAQAGEAAIQFFPDGSSTGGELTFQDNARIWVVRVNWLSGHVATQEGISP